MDGPLAASRCQSAGRSRTTSKQGAIHERDYDGRLTSGQRLHWAEPDITKPSDRSEFDPKPTKPGSQDNRNSAVQQGHRSHDVLTLKSSTGAMQPPFRDHQVAL